MFKKIKNLLRISDFLKRIELLESETDFLKKKVEDHENTIKDLGKKTISQTTLEEDKPISMGQIMNEWLNGEEEKSGT